MTTDILSKIAAAAQADAVSFIEEFPGADLDGSDWDSAAFEMHRELASIDGAFEVYSKQLNAEIERLSGRLSE